MGTSSVGSLRLVHGDVVKPHAEYVSLSHCWGDFDPPKLEIKTLQSFQVSIDPAALPSTFADAVDITRQLGIRYLWIDSLCIVQDDEHDWQRESAKMSQIYECAWLNIGASKALTATGGCYSTRCVEDVNPVILASSQFDVQHDMSLNDLAFWEKDFEGSLLMHRAWILQEQYLSSRTIHFARNQIFWRCHELQACETSPDGIPDRARRETDAYRVFSASENDLTASQMQTKLMNAWFSKRYLTILWSHGENIPLNHESARQLFEAWEAMRKQKVTWGNIVNKYTSAALTFPEKDKLVAVSGLAKRCGHQRDYLAGLWRPMLPWELLWNVAYYDEKENKLEAPPTWSWASSQSPVRLHRSNYLSAYMGCELPVVKIIAAETSLVGPDAFGQVTGGTIRLSSVILKSHESSIPKYLYPDYACSFTDASIFWLAILRTDNNPHDPRNPPPGIEGIWIEPTGRVIGEYRRRGTFNLPADASHLWSSELESYTADQLLLEECEKYDGLKVIEGSEIKKKYHFYTISLV